MRRYDEPVEVRCGLLAGTETEVPEQFLWRGRLWKVRSVLEHWVETGEWWRHAGVRAVIGSDEPTGDQPARPRPLEDLLAERAVWRVEAGRGAAVRGLEDAGGVFDLALDVDARRWQLVGCAD
ncbi:hypothetical protein I601_2714 [Nocardioides dokdonensis FR1436]|uniref:DUF6504 domain-containing protein n=1 Tax=Nocardioides dokdonensis FR1436 TaxID=1300347 RepID=A0A1A9GN92_9ACTN|nr:DUF6504 family protein [Nocardioides dokdonensis]ANH39130.1 hypothetical protein I601_2714 [Nocardioides dokdonensis FR1436]